MNGGNSTVQTEKIVMKSNNLLLCNSNYDHVGNYDGNFQNNTKENDHR